MKNMGHYIAGAQQFVNGVRQEFAKVIWPTRAELLQVSWVVLLVVTAFAIYLGALDLLIGHIARKVLAL